MALPSPTIHYRATREATNDLFDLIEYSVPPYCTGPSLQQHAQPSLCYVLGGFLAFTLDERTITAARSVCILIPPGTAYTFFNPTASPASFLLWRVLSGAQDANLAPVQ